MSYEIRSDFEHQVPGAVRTYLRENYLHENPEHPFQWCIYLVWFGEEEDDIFTIESSRFERDRCGIREYRRTDVVRTICRGYPVEVISCEIW